MVQGRQSQNLGGTTIAELLVVMFLFGILLYAAFLFVDRSVTLYRDHSDALEMRQEALFGLSRMATELRDSARSSISIDDTVGSSGLVFTSNKGPTGNAEFNANSGRVFWQKFVCYYQDEMSNEVGVVNRKEEYLLQPESDFVPDPSGQSPPRLPGYFRSNGALRPTLIAKNVSVLEFEMEADLIEVLMVIRLERRYEHLIEVRTKVFPRS